MKKFLLETAKIVGTTTDQAWSQVHTFSPTEEKKLARRGQFLAVISLSGLEEGIETVTVGKEILSRLHEEYYGHLEAKAIDQLKKALEQVTRETEGEVQIEIEAAVLIGEIIYFAVAGEGRILVQREGKTATVLLGNKGEVEIASGRVVKDDVFLLGNPRFFSFLAEGAISAALSMGSVNEAAESLTPMVHGQEKDGIAAAVISKIIGPKEEEVPTTTPSDKEQEKPGESSFKVSGLKTGLKDKLTDWLKVGAKIGRGFLFKIEKKLKRRAIYLEKENKEKEKTRRTLITIAAILLVLLMVSIVLGIRQRGRGQTSSGQNAILQQAQIKKEEGEALIDLNPIRARQLLLEARDLIDEIEPEEANQAVLDFREELEASLSLVMREHEVEPKAFFELGIIKDGAKGDDLAVSGKELILFDRGKQAIYSLEIDSKKSAILAGGENLADGHQVAAFLPKIFLLTERGIVQFDKETKREELVIETDEEWGEIVDLRAFGGNLYLLDKKGEIWKYPGIEGGFGAYRRWLQGSEVDFSNAVGMSIDASVWILKSNGSVLKYTQGLKDGFTISGLDKSFSNPTAIFTDDDQENLYILDQGNSRVVVINKSGEYYSQYRWEGMNQVTSLMASEEEGKIFLLAGDKIYQIDLK
ncbi:MAG TPA: hypothetical protein VMY36_02965 [Patescibacteria group bacterium]|nr:hypothetical protein [Patescibacteria group bacterium]